MADWQPGDVAICVRVQCEDGYPHPRLSLNAAYTVLEFTASADHDGIMVLHLLETANDLLFDDQGGYVELPGMDWGFDHTRFVKKPPEITREQVNGEEAWWTAFEPGRKVIEEA